MNLQLNDKNMNNKKEERYLSDDAIEIMAMLPSGLTEPYIEKAFNVFGRTKAEIAAPELLKALIEIRSQMNATIPEKYFDMVDEVIKKATI